jgi:cytochrome c
LEVCPPYPLRRNPEGIVAWAKAPGKKRPELPQMPPFAHLGEANLRKLADMMLEMGKAKLP